MFPDNYLPPGFLDENPDRLPDRLYDLVTWFLQQNPPPHVKSSQNTVKNQLQLLQYRI